MIVYYYEGKKFVCISDDDNNNESECNTEQKKETHCTCRDDSEVPGLQTVATRHGSNDTSGGPTIDEETRPTRIPFHTNLPPDWPLRHRASHFTPIPTHGLAITAPSFRCIYPRVVAPLRVFLVFFLDDEGLFVNERR